jgi:hypothetical protein
MKALNLTIQMLKLNAAVASRLQSNFSILNDAKLFRVILAMAKKPTTRSAAVSVKVIAITP